MIRALLLFLLCASISGAAEYTIPAANQGDWEPGVDVGVTGGIAQYLAGGVNDRAVTGTVVDMSAPPYSCDPTGVDDCRATIITALAAASGATVLYFPAGTYKITTGFIYSNYKDNITIRGAGPGVTTFYCSASNVQGIFKFSEPGSNYGTSLQTVTGTKTKGTDTLTVSSSSAYPMNNGITILYENEVDLARIEAGAAPVWSSSGYPNSRKAYSIVTGQPDSTHITIFPPLPGDGTNLTLTAATWPGTNRTENWGFEDFSVTFDNAAHPQQFITMDAGYNSWVYNVNFEDYSRPSTNGSCIKISNSFKCEVNHCSFHAETGSNSDGAIESVLSSCLLYIDNIITGPFKPAFYDSGNMLNSAILYNYCDEGFGYFHNAHPSLNLMEGNIGKSHQSDGYHGSSSHNNFYRNWFYGASGLILNRFKRNAFICGNVLGIEGTTSGGISWGNPNIGNGFAKGFAGPTGNSLLEGAFDYAQPGYGVTTGSFYSYEIQSSDIFAGDFWEDWEITGTLTTRTSDTVGVFTMDKGDWYTGISATSQGTLAPNLFWNNKASSMPRGTVTAVSGALVTITFPSGTLPMVGESIQTYMFNGGWQERDLDVEASSTVANNFFSLAATGGSVQASVSPDTLPDSLAYTSTPGWWPAGMTYPPIDPDSPAFSVEAIPAGYRYVNGVEYGEIPILSSAVIGTSGDTITFNFPAAITIGSGGNAGWALTLSTGSATATYSSGDGTTALVYSLSSTVDYDTTGTVAYTQPGDGFEDGLGTDLATLSGFTITNNSTVNEPDPVPTLSSSVIGTSGTAITFNFSEAVTVGSGGNAGWVLSLSSGSATATYSSGSGTAALVYSLSSTVYSGTTGTVAYTQPGDGLEDGVGGDLASLSGATITNNSTETAPSPPTGTIEAGNVTVTGTLSISP